MTTPPPPRRPGVTPGRGRPPSSPPPAGSGGSLPRSQTTRHRRTVATDSGEILTAGEVEQRIARASDAMDDLTDDFDQQAIDKAVAEATYKVKFAKERIKHRARPGGGSGPGGRVTNDEADDHATVACEVELMNRLVTEEVLNATDQSLRSLRSQLDALRTLAANIRAQT